VWTERPIPSQIQAWKVFILPARQLGGARLRLRRRGGARRGAGARAGEAGGAGVPGGGQRV